jgi:hypothetical protein
MNELEQDLKKLVDHVDCFQEKHNCCMLSAMTVSIDEKRAACQVYLKGGDTQDLHMLCHGLLKSPRFVDEMFDAIKCVINKSNPEKGDTFKNFLIDSTLETIKKLVLLIAVKEREAESDAEDTVKKFLDGFYHEH